MSCFRVNKANDPSTSSQRKDNADMLMSENSEIQERYDNKTTQNLCDLMNQANMSGKIFIPVKKVTDQDIEYGKKLFKEEMNAPLNHEGTTVFSKQGLIMVGKGRGAPSKYVSHDALVRDGMNKQIYANLPIFRKFPLLKTFKQWKYSAQYKKYQRKRELLCKNLVFSKPQFAQGYAMINHAINDIKDLKFLEIKKSTIFARKQQSLTEKTERVDIIRSQGDLSKILYRIKMILKQLKDTILKDDALLDEERRKWQELEILKKSKYEDHIVFTKARKRRELEGEKMKVSKTRHTMFDSLIAYVNRYVSSNLAQVLFENKKDFTEVLLDPAISPQFELSV